MAMLNALGGFAQGFAQSFGQTYQTQQERADKQQQAELQKSLWLAENLPKIFDPSNPPPVMELQMKLLSQHLGIDPKQIEDFRKFATKADEETRLALADTVRQFLGDVPPEKLNALVTRGLTDPKGFNEFLDKLADNMRANQQFAVTSDRAERALAGQQQSQANTASNQQAQLALQQQRLAMEQGRAEPQLVLLQTDVPGVGMAGDTVTARETQDGRLLIGQTELSPQQAIPLAGTAAAQDLPKSKDIIGIRKQQAATAQMAQVADQLINMVQSNPAALGVPGALSRVVASAVPQFEALADLAGVSTEGVSKDLASYGGVFERMGNAAQISSDTKSAMIDMAYLMAIAKGLGTGQGLSNKDVENQLAQLGAGTGSPEIFAKTLAGTINRAIQGFQTQYEAVLQQPAPDIPFAASGIGAFGDEFAGVSSELPPAGMAPGGMSPQEFNQAVQSLPQTPEEWDQLQQSDPQAYEAASGIAEFLLQSGEQVP